MRDFVAIDFETANYYRTSACSVGAVRYRDGKFEDSFYSLIHPHPNFYKFTYIHGITKEDTEAAPTFDVVWEQLKPFIGRLPLVAHNSPFDKSVLLKTLEFYGQTFEPTFYCTLRAARNYLKAQLPNCQLHTVAAYYGFDLTAHHHALADAEACAVIALNIL